MSVDRFRGVTGNRDVHLIAIGELTSYKRFDLAIAAARLTKRPLVIVGDGPDRRRLEQMAGPDVRFLGRVPDAAVLDAMQGASALIHPGIEDFGIVMAEAVAAGLPVIAHGGGGAAEIIDERSGVLVDELEPVAFARAIESVRRTRFDPNEARRCAERFGVERFRRELCIAVERAAMACAAG